MKTIRNLLSAASIVVVAGAVFAWAETTAEEIMALDQARLIDIVKDPQAGEFARAKACQRLAIVGTGDAVPALAALLSDPQLAHYARFGLEPIPDPSVDSALRNALKKLKGKLLVGVISSIGHRKDPAAVGPLSKYLKSSDTEVAQSAAEALGRIGGPQAARILEKALTQVKAPVRPAVADAGMMCAEGFLAHGQQKQALDLYEAVSRADVPQYVRLAATRGAEQVRK